MNSRGAGAIFKPGTEPQKWLLLKYSGSFEGAPEEESYQTSPNSKKTSSLDSNKT